MGWKMRFIASLLILGEAITLLALLVLHALPAPRSPFLVEILAALIVLLVVSAAALWRW